MPKLLEQKPSIAVSSSSPATDRVGDQVAAGTPAALQQELQRILGADKVLGRASDLVRYASDASPYRLVPQVVVVPETADEVAAVLAHCAAQGLPATFRAGGTSLSGQSQTEGVLIDVRHHWGGMVVEDDGARLRVRPGTVLANANAVLARYGRRLGPDPASSKAACIGGVVANNAAGMRCTPERSVYATLRELTFVTPRGTKINTEAPDAEAEFAASEPELADGLMTIRHEILADPELVELITRKYSIRNTTGYTMRAFLDGETPLGIYRRLLVGSEGTLGFIAEVVLDTIPIPAVTGIVWVHLASTEQAVSLVRSMTELGAEAVELLQSSSLRSAAANLPEPPEGWADLPATGASLLVEFAGDSVDELRARAAQVAELAAPHDPFQPVELGVDPLFAAASWKVRSEMTSDLALARPEGAITITEDVCFPPERLAEGIADLRELLVQHGYPAYVAGHAAYGNMHFSLTPSLSDEAGKQNYASFMRGFAQLVDDYCGSLKAEHGTGLNMAPFVEREWGTKAYDLMWRTKRLADPSGVLGKDVVLTGDPQVHLRGFKADPLADPLIDKCIECGFCEPVCPSRFVTTTPRQRIALRREMARQAPGSPVQQALLEEYQYDAIETCAADSSCAIACPYGIDTGAVMKNFRAEEASAARNGVAAGLARRWGLAERGARLAIGAVDLVQQRVGHRLVQALTTLPRTMVSNDLVPTVPGPMPRAANPDLPTTHREGAAAVYFPACVNRIFGRDPGVPADAISLPEALVAVSSRAGRPLWIPGDVGGHCCGTIWSSKGYTDGRDLMYEKVARSILEWTDDGARPVICDAASCTHGLLSEVPKHLPDELATRYAKVQVVDSLVWVNELVSELSVSRKLDSVVVHTGCSVRRMGLEPTFLSLAAALAETVNVPYGSACCGTAGDRGLLHPELVRSATREERADLETLPADAYLSNNRTCEMGLRQATGRPFESIVLTLEELTRP